MHITLETMKRAEEAVKTLRENAQNEALGILPRSESPYLIELFQKKLDSLTVKRDRTRAKRVFNCFLRLLPDRIKVIELKRAHLK